LAKRDDLDMTGTAPPLEQ